MQTNKRKIPTAMKEELKNAHWVCQECGTKWGKGKQFTISTWHEGYCDVCGQLKSLTETRDFGYLLGQ